MAIRFEWSPLCVEDAEALFKAQNEFVKDHEILTKPHSSATFDRWKEVLGYPSDDTKRLEFIQKMATASTKHGKSLHCLKLVRYEGDRGATAGFIDFEVRKITDENLAGTVREIYIRSVIVFSHMRQQGCGRKLYHALFQYLSPGELDVIRLYVVDLNQAAINFYFKLGFRITQWFFRQLGEDTKTEACFKAVFLCMQKLHGKQVDSGSATSIALQDMPHLFNEQVVGEVVYVDCEDNSREWTQRAVIDGYDPRSQTFTIARLRNGVESGLPQPLVPNLCVNDLFSCGHLTFEKPPSILMNKDVTPFTSCESIAKSSMAEPEQWPSVGLVATPEKRIDPRKRVLWPVPDVCPSKSSSSENKLPVGASHADVGPGNVGAACRAMVPYRGGTPRKPVPRIGKRKAAELFEFGYLEGKWRKGGEIDFELKLPDGRVIKAGPATKISFNDENPKQKGTKAFKHYARYKKATTVYEYCALQGKHQTRAVVYRDIKHDVQWGHAKIGKACGGLSSGGSSQKPLESGTAKSSASSSSGPGSGLNERTRAAVTHSSAGKRGSMGKSGSCQSSTPLHTIRKRPSAALCSGPRKMLRTRNGIRRALPCNGARSTSVYVRLESNKSRRRAATETRRPKRKARA